MTGKGRAGCWRVWRLVRGRERAGEGAHRGTAAWPGRKGRSRSDEGGPVLTGDEILRAWEARWGLLTDIQRSMFLRHPDLETLTTKDRGLVEEAIRANQGLTDALRWVNRMGQIEPTGATGTPPLEWLGRRKVRTRRRPPEPWGLEAAGSRQPRRPPPRSGEEREMLSEGGPGEQDGGDAGDSADL